MSTITSAEEQAIINYLNGRHIPRGLGSKEAACSIAAINLALTGEMTDRIPGCMSLVIGKWIIRTQDAMPDKMRNSAEWRTLLPLAAGTGRRKEKERLAIILGWMWCTVLPKLQSIADQNGFGVEWGQMCEEKTKKAADAAAKAAAAKAADAADTAAYAVDTAVYAADAADTAAYAADADAADAAVYAAYAAGAAYKASRAAVYAAYAAAYADADAADAAGAEQQFWIEVNPCGLLAKLVA